MPFLLPTQALNGARHHIRSSLIVCSRRLVFPVPLSRDCRRSYRRGAVLRGPYKDDQDRETLKPRTHDSSQGPSDGEIATRYKTPFDADKTDPKSQSDSATTEAGEGGDGENPLELTGANRELSRSPQAEGGDKLQSGAGGKQKSSSKSSKKAGKVV